MLCFTTYGTFLSGQCVRYCDVLSVRARKIRNSNYRKPHLKGMVFLNRRTVGMLSQQVLLNKLRSLGNMFIDFVCFMLFLIKVWILMNTLIVVDKRQ